MGEVVLKVENVSKLYRLGEVGTGTLSHDINRWWAKVRGKEDPYSLIGQTNDRSASAESDYVWALKDINFQVAKGEILGIIGKNGAGKSTLLKLLSQITSPTSGAIKSKGRIASLLEVGTGMHPEMTARENIYLNGAILGMNKKEIASKFDDIIDFSGCKLYVDTPIKRFSSGMRVRLGFAVAAFLEPEILIVDEVLAVGDAEFQKKAIGKMKDITTGGGRTVLFVSHNMATIKSLCTKTMILYNGQQLYSGDTSTAIAKYLEKYEAETTSSKKWDKIEKAPGNENIKLLSIDVSPIEGDVVDTKSGIRMTLEVMNYKVDTRIGFNMRLLTSDEIVVFTIGKLIANGDSKEGVYTIEIDIPKLLLNQGTYKPLIWFGEYRTKICGLSENIFSFQVLGRLTEDGLNPNILPGVTLPNVPIKATFKG